MTTDTKNPEQQMIHIKAVTWLKDSHSLFDYQFNKNILQDSFNFTFQHQFGFIFRNNKTSQIEIIKSQTFNVPENANQLLGCFQIKPEIKKTKVQFHHASQLVNKKKNPEETTIKTQGSAKEEDKKEEDIYLIVRSLKNKNNQNKGYKLEAGHIVKLGRVQYRVSSIKKTQNGKAVQSTYNNPFFSNNQTYSCDQQIEKVKKENNLECKYCLRQQQQQGNFFVSPCNCIGSAGIVHFKCLEQWIQSKVKKEVIGGTRHYNFQKFFCQLCKKDFPRYLKRNNEIIELMPIERPQGSYVILQGITQKSNNLIVLQNIPTPGIKIGRSHDCEIRITDISVSRMHATIQRVDDQFFVFDCKSKFGTLIKQQNLILEIGKVKQGIQIGRSVFTFQVSKK